MFPVTSEELIPQDHLCRVIEAFVERMNLAALSFERAEPADRGSDVGSRRGQQRDDRGGHPGIGVGLDLIADGLR